MTRIAIVAGEVSGDRLGSGLIAAVRGRDPLARFAGIAGPGMVAAGCEAWLPSEELAVANRPGIARIAPSFSRVSSSAVAGREPSCSAESSLSISSSDWYVVSDLTELPADTTPYHLE